MALRVTATTRFCINCKINSDDNAGKKFHEIFDDVGLELQLPSLVETFFHIDVKNKDKQHLCDDCVNRLIELYDMVVHTNDKSKTNNLKKKKECSNNEESSKYLQIESRNFRYELENDYKPFAIVQNNTQVTLPKSSYIECTNFETSVSTQGETALEIHKENKSEDKDRTEYENIEDVGHFVNKNRFATFTLQQNKISSDIGNYFPKEYFDQNGEKDLSQDFEISLPSGAKKDKKSDELEFNEHIEFIIDDGVQNVKINKQSNKKIPVNACENVDETLEAYTPNKIHNENEGRENLYVEEVDDRSNQGINSCDSNSLLEELEISKEKEALLLNEGITDDTYSLEEEDLIAETILSDEFDQVDLNWYLDTVLLTKFEDLQLNWDVECKLCLEKYNSFGELLKHQCMAEFEREQQLSCIIKDCEEDAKDLPTLARHLILTHYDKLESTTIHGKCKDCQKTFSSVLDFNKHSCCRKIKRKTGTPNYCKYCDLNFQSFKRYVFHTQFHLKNHRPKICLLCGDLFNNSNDFFEHTQYKHNPKTASACERCDRFFNDIQAFNYHMKIHDDSKYLYECARCPKKYTAKFGLIQHMDISHNHKFNAFKCEYCPKKFGYKKVYINHVKSHATDAKVQAFICSRCGLITNKMEIIKDHIESDNKSPCFSSPVDKKILGLCYSCVNCSLDFCTIKHLKDHRLSDTHSDDLFHCGLCRKSFNTFHHMRNHLTKHKNFEEWQKLFPITKHFVCNVEDCEEFYSTWVSLYQHKKRLHKTNEETNLSTEFKCQFCQQSYSLKHSLSVHVTRSHINAKIKCSYCMRSFNSQNHLQKHIVKSHIPVECDICFKKFKCRLYLESHMNLHEKKVHKNNNHKCKLCNFVTIYPASLKMHMEIHNNRLKFKCFTCYKLFGSKPQLESHVKKHLNKNKYSCARYLNESGCNASFLTYNLLKKHAHTKHKTSSFSINLKREEHRKNYHVDVKIENVSNERLTCDDSSVYEEQPQKPHEIYFNDEDFEQDASISTMEDEMEFEEQKPDIESLKI